MKCLAVALLSLVGFCGCNRETATTAAENQPDNSGVNVRDRDSSAKTPIDQNENQSDVDITAAIRKRVIDADLSTNAENAKVITQNGKVTLRGPVKSAEEKKQIEDIANDVVGQGNVESHIEVE
jgi:hyperosmotically inducible protein